MKLTINQGEKALQTGETPVGCVLVYDDKIVGSGMNDTNKSMNVSALKYDLHGKRIITVELVSYPFPSDALIKEAHPANF